MSPQPLSISRYAAKQKKVRQWREFAEKEVANHTLRAKILQLCQEVTDSLAAAWTAGGLTSSQEEVLLDLERQLRDLFDDSRLHAAAHNLEERE